MKLSRKNLISRLEQIKGSRIITIEALTKETRLRAKDSFGNPNPYWGKLLKLSRVNGLINWSYENAVNNQRVREGQPLLPDGSIERFKSLPRAWGVRKIGTPFIEHKGKVYIEMMVLNSSHQYVVDDEYINEADITSFLAPKKESSRQKTKKSIILRDYAIDNILRVKMNKVLYELT